MNEHLNPHHEAERRALARALERYQQAGGTIERLGPTPIRSFGSKGYNNTSLAKSQRCASRGGRAAAAGKIK